MHVLRIGGPKKALNLSNPFLYELTQTMATSCFADNSYKKVPARNLVYIDLVPNGDKHLIKNVICGSLILHSILLLMTPKMPQATGRSPSFP